MNASTHVNALRNARLQLVEFSAMLMHEACNCRLGEPEETRSLVDKCIAVLNALEPHADKIDAAADFFEQQEQLPSSDDASSAPIGNAARVALCMSAGWEIDQLIDAAFNAHSVRGSNGTDLAVRGLLLRIRNLGDAITTAVDDSVPLSKDAFDNLRITVYGSAEPRKSEGAVHG